MGATCLGVEKNFMLAYACASLHRGFSLDRSVGPCLIGLGYPATEEEIFFGYRELLWVTVRGSPNGLLGLGFTRVSSHAG